MHSLEDHCGRLHNSALNIVQHILQVSRALTRAVLSCLGTYTSHYFHVNFLTAHYHFGVFLSLEAEGRTVRVRVRHEVNSGHQVDSRACVKVCCFNDCRFQEDEDEKSYPWSQGFPSSTMHLTFTIIAVQLKLFRRESRGARQKERSDRWCAHGRPRGTR